MMQKLRLIGKEMAGSPVISLVVFIVVLVSALCFAVFQTAGVNINRYIDTKFAKAIPPNEIKVTPKSVSSIGLFGITLKKKKELGLDDAAVAKIRNLAGVTEVYPFMASQIPLQAVIAVFGLQYRTDLVCIGVPYDFIEPDLPNAQDKTAFRKWKPGKELPVLVPQILLEAYNNSMAEPNGLPKITREFAAGKSVQIYFGKSSIKSEDGFSVENGRVIGFTDKVANLCLVVPLPALEYYNAKFKPGGAKDYMSAVVHVKDHKNVPDLIKKLKGLNLNVETEKSLSEEILALKNNAAAAVNGLSFIVLFLALIASVFSAMISVFSRIEYYRILRLLGASRIFITLSVWIKYAVLGLLSVTAALYLTGAAGDVLSKTAAVPGFTIDWKLTSVLKQQLLLAGAVLPVLATLPGLFRLFSGNLASD